MAAEKLSRSGRGQPYAAESWEREFRAWHSSDQPHDGVTMTGRLARLDTYWAKSSVAIVSVHGDIDGTNAHALTSIPSPTWRIVAG
jgi:hypothetical protein